MYLTDLHTHTILSPDGVFPLSEMARSAVHAGISVMAVTDHFDMLDTDGKRVLDYDWGPSLEQFHSTVPLLRDQLELKFGLELGSLHISPDHARMILARAGSDLDVVIGSLHNFREENGGGEYYFGVYSSPQICHFALDDYFTSMEELVAAPDCYDILGHIIYPLRYMHRDGQNISLEPYWDRLAEILRTVIHTGRSIEVNTCRGHTVADWRGILELYRDLGGKLVTTGSDAHQSADLGKGLVQACRLLQSCGFDRIAVYSHRTPELIKI